MCSSDLVAATYGIQVVFFDGRGGPPARGGGNTHDFYASLGPTVSSGEIQITIQGQTISSNFGRPVSCTYNLEQLLSAGVEQDVFGPKAVFTEEDKQEVLALQQAAIKEIVPVYEEKFRLTQDIVLASESILKPILDGDKVLKVRGKLRYQACDDKICYLPQSAPLEFTLKLEPLDRQRVDEKIQHKTKTDK